MVVRNMSLTELVRAENRRLYMVDFGYDNIFVTVTRNPKIVAFWIVIVRMAYSERLRDQSLVVGVRVEWRRSSSNPPYRYRVDILQLCVGGYCLIFQIGLANNGNISQELVDFLGNRNITFVGVGIHSHIRMLNRDYGIRFNENFLDLNALASFWLGLQNIQFFRNYGLPEMSNLVLRMYCVRPITIIMSRWNQFFLRYDQILYAFVDVYFCYLMGEYLSDNRLMNFGNVSRN